MRHKNSTSITQVWRDCARDPCDRCGDTLIFSILILTVIFHQKGLHIQKTILSLGRDFKCVLVQLAFIKQPFLGEGLGVEETHSFIHLLNTCWSRTYHRKQWGESREVPPLQLWISHLKNQEMVNNLSSQMPSCEILAIYSWKITFIKWLVYIFHWE